MFPAVAMGSRHIHVPQSVRAETLQAFEEKKNKRGVSGSALQCGKWNPLETSRVGDPPICLEKEWEPVKTWGRRAGGWKMRLSNGQVRAATAAPSPTLFSRQLARLVGAPA